MRLFFISVFLLQAGCSLSTDAESTARKFVELYYSPDHYDTLKTMTRGRAAEKIGLENDFRNHSSHSNQSVFYQLHDRTAINSTEYFYFNVHFSDVDHERELCITVTSIESKFMISDFYYTKD
ncbi:hypothetical protein HUU42_06420 [bacterium]|nr:hypothetical protein [bacterium]